MFPRLASTAPRAARTRIRLVHTYELWRTVVTGASDRGRASVLLVMPSQYSGPARYDSCGDQHEP